MEESTTGDRSMRIGTDAVSPTKVLPTPGLSPAAPERAPAPTVAEERTTVLLDVAAAALAVAAAVAAAGMALVTAVPLDAPAATRDVAESCEVVAVARAVAPATATAAREVTETLEATAVVPVVAVADLGAFLLAVGLPVAPIAARLLLVTTAAAVTIAVVATVATTAAERAVAVAALAEVPPVVRMMTDTPSSRRTWLVSSSSRSESPVSRRRSDPNAEVPPLTATAVALTPTVALSEGRWITVDVATAIEPPMPELLEKATETVS